jgi:hypothetical protein
MSISAVILCVRSRHGVRFARHILMTLVVANCLHAAMVMADPIQVGPLVNLTVSENTIVGHGQGSSTGSELDFYGFDSSQFSQLYFGVNPSEPSQFYLPMVSLNGVHTTLTFQEVDGTTAMWGGSTVADLSGGGPTTIPLRFLMTVTGLGNSPWVDAATVGLPPVMGAAVADPAGLDFNVQFYFQADYGTGFGPLTPAPFGSRGGSVGSAWGHTFFIVRPTPEPSTVVLAITGIAGLAMIARARRRV